MDLSSPEPEELNQFEPPAPSNFGSPRRDLCEPNELCEDPMSSALVNSNKAKPAVKKLKFGEPCSVAQAKAEAKAAAAEASNSDDDKTDEKMTTADQSRKKKLRAGTLTPNKCSLAEIKAQSVARFENEDDDKYTEKKLTTALRTLSFTFQKTTEWTCDKQLSARQTLVFLAAGCKVANHNKVPELKQCICKSCTIMLTTVLWQGIRQVC